LQNKEQPKQIKHIRSSSELGKLLKCQLQWAQRTAGIDEPILVDVNSKLPQLKEEVWIQTLRKRRASQQNRRCALVGELTADQGKLDNWCTPAECWDTLNGDIIIKVPATMDLPQPKQRRCRAGNTWKEFCSKLNV
jgi:hypothetical protein